MTRLICLLAWILPSALAAQIVPQPSAENPRIQSVRWMPNEEVLLTTLPKTGLTVMLEPGEQVERVSVENQSVLDIRVSPELDSMLILPLVDQLASGFLVQTDRRDYRFTVRSDTSLLAAYLVKFDFGSAQTGALETAPKATGEQWFYSFKGDRSVRPEQVSDDGLRTRIVFGTDQALPAVFAIGPTGKEEVVNGYMRGGIFVIDRVHSELVFRIDKDKATARRNRSSEKLGG